MPRKARPSKGDVDLVFDRRQLLSVFVVGALVLAGAFLWGFETGHKRGTLGQPSILGHLQEAASSAVRLSGAEEGVTVPTSAEDKPPDHPRDRRPKPEPGINSGRTPPAAPSFRSQPTTVPVAEVPVADRDAVRTEAPLPGRLHFQIAALSVQANAHGLARSLQSEGLPVRTQSESEDGLYRVYVGPFASDAEASAARQRLTKYGFQVVVSHL